MNGSSLARLLMAALLPWTHMSAQEARVFPRGQWEVVSRLEDETGDVFVNPQRLVHCGWGLVVMDYDDQHLVAVDTALRTRWRFGRRGSGPGEFQQLGGVSCDASGQLWVLDRGNAKLVRLRSDGRTFSEARLSVGSRRGEVLARGGHWMGITQQGKGEIATVFDSTGNVVRLVLAVPEVAALNPAQREAFIATTPEGGAIIAFRWSSLLLRVSPDGSASVLHAGIGRIPFAEYKAYPTGERNEAMLRIDPDAVEAVRTITVRADTVFVIAPDGSDEDRSILDLYSIRERRYLESRRLNFTAPSVSSARGELFVLLQEPTPGIVRLRWTGSTR